MAPSRLGDRKVGEPSLAKSPGIKPLQALGLNSSNPKAKPPLVACSNRALESLSKVASAAEKLAGSTGEEHGQSGRGALIVLEGLDRSGKSSQCEQLAHFLECQGRQIRHLRFPDRSTETGKQLSAYLRNAAEIDDETVHRLFFENRLEKLEEMESALAAGISLVVDRYSYSGAAFSAAKGLDLTWCQSIEHRLPAPDVVFFLDLPVEVAAARGGYGEERYEKQEFQRAVAFQFAKLRDSSWQTIDADRPWEEIQQELRERAEATISSCLSQAPPLKRIWTDTC